MEVANEFCNATNVLVMIQNVEIIVIRKCFKLGSGEHRARAVLHETV